MYRKLTPEETDAILEAGIDEFALKGPDGASMQGIANRAGVSVGVLYKYYKNKEHFFESCLRRCLVVLEDVIRDVLEEEDKILVRAEKLIRAIQKIAKEHPRYNVLYQELTSGSCRAYAARYARDIETISGLAYTSFLRQAQEEGLIRQDADARLLAFFFDSLLMMLQFSYSCDYYRERFRIYCGEDILDDDEKVVSELLKFLESAFTFEADQIQHGGG
ncbi:MAG TPA: TetR/AcrR family transcriptional regulator [Clostridiaceae bacterium]|nr:TetR/AcrR family transcriptional regulator [Clostridiaceae bacterium]